MGEIVLLSEVSVMLFVNGGSLPVETSLFQCGRDLETVGRHKSPNKTVCCELHLSPSSKPSLIFDHFGFPISCSLTVRSNESAARLTSCLVMDVVGYDVTLVFPKSYKPVKLLIIWNLVPVRLSLTSSKHVSLQSLSRGINGSDFRQIPVIS